LIWKNDISYPFAFLWGVALTGEDHCIYVFGGMNSSGDAVSNSYKFNTTAGYPRGLFLLLSKQVLSISEIET